MAGVGTEYLRVVRAQFKQAKDYADRAIAQVSDEQLFWSPGAESNSIAVIVKHVAGNMVSRWTDFLTTDGEKPDRERDAEFVADAVTRKELLDRWEEGWRVFLGTLDSLTEEDLLRTVTIRRQPHTVIEAVERQMYHYSYHIGQIVYLAKQLLDADWRTLTIPRRR
jgi:uncharacterized damage-inducible protein DinB